MECNSLIFPLISLIDLVIDTYAECVHCSKDARHKKSLDDTVVSSSLASSFFLIIMPDMEIVLKILWKCYTQLISGRVQSVAFSINFAVLAHFRTHPSNCEVQTELCKRNLNQMKGHWRIDCCLF